MNALQLKKELEKVNNFANVAKEAIITIESGQIIYAGYNEKLILSSEIDIQEQCTVSLLELYKVIKALKNKEISFVVTASHLQIITGSTNLSISLQKELDFSDVGTDFTEIGKLENSIDLKRAANFVGCDDLRPVMNNIFVSAENSEICATDAHKLFYCPVDSAFLKDVFLSKKLVSVLEKDGCITFSENENYLQVLQNNATFYIKKEGHKYPKYRSVIPEKKSDTMSIEISTAELLEFIALAKIQGNTTTKRIDVDIHKDSTFLSSEDVDFNRSVSHSVIKPVITNFLPYENDIFGISLNFGFLEQILKLDKKESTVFYVSDPRRAILIDENYLIMPVLRNY